MKRSPEWTWTGVWAFGSTIQQDGLPFTYQFSHPTNEEKKQQDSKQEPSESSATAKEETTKSATAVSPAIVKAPDDTKKVIAAPLAPQTTHEESKSAPPTPIIEPPQVSAPPAAQNTAAPPPPLTAVPIATEKPPVIASAKQEPSPAVTTQISSSNSTATTSKVGPPAQTEVITSPPTTSKPPPEEPPLPKEIHIRGNTLPAGGLWKGSFEAMMPSRKGEQRTMVNENFIMQWNKTDIEKETTILHIAGTGQNQFGNFKLMGSLDLTTFVLQCHREYIIAPPPAPRSYQTRKRQLSWKRRDVYEESPEAKSGGAQRKSATPSNKKAKTSQNLTIQIPVIPMGNTKRVPASAGALPNVPDPYMARWRSAHFLYYYTSPETNDPSKYVVYEGDMVHGMRDGRGVCLYNNGLLYEGEWKDDREHGHGTLRTSDRKMIIYQGEWERGRLHGRGTYYYHEASSTEASSEHDPPRHFYQGEFRENLRNGTGHYQLSDGSIYNGGWRDGTMAGRGVFTWPDGSIYDGDWKDNKR